MNLTSYYTHNLFSNVQPVRHNTYTSMTYTLAGETHMKELMSKDKKSKSNVQII